MARLALRILLWLETVAVVLYVYNPLQTVFLKKLLIVNRSSHDIHVTMIGRMKAADDLTIMPFYLPWAPGLPSLPPTSKALKIGAGCTILYDWDDEVPKSLIVRSDRGVHEVEISSSSTVEIPPLNVAPVASTQMVEFARSRSRHVWWTTCILWGFAILGFAAPLDAIRGIARSLRCQIPVP